MQTVVLCEGERKFIHSLLDEGIRLDGRDYQSIREFTVEKNPLALSPASCRVIWGTGYGDTTEVIVSVSTEVAKTESSAPVVSVKALRKSLGTDESEGICENVQATLLLFLKNSGCLDPGQFVVMNSPFSWKLFIDILIVRGAGALCDAAMIGIRETLSDLTFPQLIVTPGETLAELHFDIDETKDNVKLIDPEKIPFAVSFSAASNCLVVDPTPVEMTVVKSLIVIGLNKSGMIVGLHHLGECGMKSWALAQITGTTKAILESLNK